MNTLWKRGSSLHLFVIIGSINSLITLIICYFSDTREH